MINSHTLALDIINNVSKYQVNRAEKMERTIDKMVVNMNKQQDMIDNHESVNRDVTSADYGYGNKNGRKTGD